MKKDGKRLKDTYQRDTYERNRKQEEKIKKKKSYGWINGGNKKKLKREGRRD